LTCFKWKKKVSFNDTFRRYYEAVGTEINMAMMMDWELEQERADRISKSVERYVFILLDESNDSS
jgi:hypothetical protein